MDNRKYEDYNSTEKSRNMILDSEQPPIKDRIFNIYLYLTILHLLIFIVALVTLPSSNLDSNTLGYILLAPLALSVVFFCMYADATKMKTWKLWRREHSKPITGFIVASWHIGIWIVAAAFIIWIIKDTFFK